MKARAAKRVEGLRPYLPVSHCRFVNKVIVLYQIAFAIIGTDLRRLANQTLDHGAVRADHHGKDPRTRSN